MAYKCGGEARDCALVARGGPAHHPTNCRGPNPVAHNPSVRRHGDAREMNLNQQPAATSMNSMMLFNSSSASNSAGNSPEHSTAGAPTRAELVDALEPPCRASNPAEPRDDTHQKRHNLDQLQHQNQQYQQQQQQQQEEVKQVELYGVRIVALTIGGRERLCLAQISNTLLKEFSYNEIHNRRVALGITCVQCTPIQLEMLRRAGAMPSSSRRCGMITMREAERLCRSFLVEEQPPDLPENFYFTVSHRVNYGCKGRFVPARYISSRAKCIECFYCGEYYSPNKFIFHSHRHPQATDCNPPDSPNINSWRKHIDLDWSQEHSQEIKYAWEDVKSLFNGGTRRRTSATATQTGGGGGGGGRSTAARSAAAAAAASLIKSEKLVANHLAAEEQLIDVEVLEGHTGGAGIHQHQQMGGGELLDSDRAQLVGSHRGPAERCSQPDASSQSLLLNQMANQHVAPDEPGSVLRRFPGFQLANQPPCKRSPTTFKLADKGAIESPASRIQQGATGELSRCFSSASTIDCPAPVEPPPLNSHLNVHPAMRELMANSQGSPINQPNNNSNGQSSKCNLAGLMYPNSAGSSSFSIYGQLYSQLAQHQPAAQLMPVETQLALRHHLWTSLLTNLQARGMAAQQAYGPPTSRGAPLHPEPTQASPSHQATLQQLTHLIQGPAGHHQYHQKQQQKQPNLQNNPHFRSGSD